MPRPRAVSRRSSPAGIVPAALEMMDDATIRAVEASIYAAGYPDRRGCGAARASSMGLPAGLDADVASVERICRDAGARNVEMASDDGAARAALAGAQEGVRRDGPHLPAARGAGCGGAAHAAARGARARSTRSALRQRVKVCNVFHAGDGNLHPNIGYDARRSRRGCARARGDGRDHAERASPPAAPSPASTAWGSTSCRTWTRCSPPSR